MALDFVAGCLGGCAGIIVGYPLDTIKVHMQTQDYRNPKYKGTWHCFRTLLAKEKVAGFYRGMSSPMAGVAAVNAIVFGIYGQTQRCVSEPDRLSSHFLAGVFAGIAQTPVCSPIELAKTRLQLQTSATGAFSGPMHCLRHIYTKEGFRGVFSGFGITLLREAPSYGIYFLTYEAMTRSSSNEPVSTFRMLWAGGMAGTLSWVISYPLDVVKSRIQAENSNRYSGIVDCFRKSVREEGYMCLYRGLNSTIIRAFPTNAATFAVVTWTFRLFQPVEQTNVEKSHSSSASHLISRTTKEHEPFVNGWNHFLEGMANTTLLTRLHCSSTLTSLLDVSSLNRMAVCLIGDAKNHTAPVESDPLGRMNLVENCQKSRTDTNGNCEERTAQWIEKAIAECGCNLHRMMQVTELGNT